MINLLSSVLRYSITIGIILFLITYGNIFFSLFILSGIVLLILEIVKFNKIHKENR